MVPFFWILGAMGVAYWAKQDGRNGWLWFVLGMALTPLGGSIALIIADRYFSVRRP